MSDPFIHPSDAVRPTLDDLRAKAAQIEAERPKLYSVGDGFGYVLCIVARNEREAERMATDHGVGAALAVDLSWSWQAMEVFPEDLVNAPRLAAAYQAHVGFGVIDYLHDDVRGA